MNFEEYKASMIKKGKDYSDARLRQFFSQRADFGGDDVVLAEPSAVSEWAKTTEYQTIQNLRGIVGKLDDAMRNHDDEYYNRIRPRVVRPVKKDFIADGPGAGFLVKAGELPPPRFSTMYAPQTKEGKWERRTRRSCSKGLLGQPCDHVVGSNQCNGGVQAIRRIGENY